MKANSKYVARFIPLVAAGLLAVSASQAATIPGSITEFTGTVTDDVFSVKSKGWRDPAFGDMGWTHSSDWGTIHAKKGQTVTINSVAADAGIHPGITVWYRGKDDTAQDNYVVDHFYPQNANFTKFGATDETSGAALGNIIMRYVTHGYDADGNTLKVKRMNPVKDDVSGQFELSFKAPYAGNYIFVVGGFNPDAGVDTSLKYNINVTATVTGP
ncbi:MAG: copper(I)-binding protein CorA [Methylococcaceae bacterium]